MGALQTIAQLGTIMSIGAHPDDETFTAGGVLAAATANGQTVVCVTATKGEAGSQDLRKWPLTTLGEIRAKELKAALAVFGVKNHHWLDCRDGQCAQADHEQVTHKLSNLIKHHQPDTILTFGPDGLTGHPDHRQVWSWTQTAVRQTGLPITILQAVTARSQYERYLKTMDQRLNIFFNIDEPKLVDPAACALYFELPEELARRKREAFRQMPSQMEAMLEVFGDDMVQKAFAVEAFVAAP